jgi:pyrroline-5-carboxylate reductase
MKIRILGIGTMGSSLVHALSHHQLFLYDTLVEKAQALAAEVKANYCHDPLEDHQEDEILIIAAKPRDIGAVATMVQGARFSLIISVLTGVTVNRLKKDFPNIPILRVMPNLAVKYGKGIVILAQNSELSPLKTHIEDLLRPLGFIQWISEDQFDAATALTGSGPAFIYALIESMVDAAILMGFSAEMALNLIPHMILSSLDYLEESKKSIEELKWQVASPSGTTIYGLKAFEKNGVRNGLIETFYAAFERAKEITKTSQN